MSFKIDDYIKGDAFEYLPRMPDKCADLVFTSCPDLSQTEFDKTSDGIRSYQEFQKKATRQMGSL